MPDHNHTELAVLAPDPFEPARLTAASFLAGYSGHTRELYTHYLRCWWAFCEAHDLAVLEVRRPHIELWARQMEIDGYARSTISGRLSTSAGFYRYCEAEEILDRSPARFVRRPKISPESTTLGLDRIELGAFITHAGVMSPRHHALACLLGLNGLRVSEACSANIEDLAWERGHRTLRIIGKGAKPATLPLAPLVARVIDAVATGRVEGPILLGYDGERLDRHSARRMVRRIAKAAGITKRISPHSLRHSFVTAALDAHVPLRDVQAAARHADPRTTTRYDRDRQSLDRHAAYVVAAFVAGGA